MRTDIRVSRLITGALTFTVYESWGATVHLWTGTETTLQIHLKNKYPTRTVEWIN